MTFRILAAGFGAAAAMLFSAGAMAATLVGGQTVVNPTAPLGALGLSAAPLNDAGVNSDGFLVFPITGGDLDGLAGEIEHDNSGIQLSDGATDVQLENFIIDTVNSVILADISLNGAFQLNAAILSFDVSSLASIDDLFNLANPMLALVFTDAAADLLESVYGLQTELNGVEFGLAATAPEVPLPGAIGFFAAGAGALALMRRRTRLNPASAAA